MLLVHVCLSLSKINYHLCPKENAIKSRGNGFFSKMKWDNGFVPNSLLSDNVCIRQIVVKSFPFFFFLLNFWSFFSRGCVFAFSNVGIRGFVCVCFRRGWVGEISDSLIKDVSKTLIKIEYPCKREATCNLQVFHLEQLSQCEAGFFFCLSSLHTNSYPSFFRFIFHTSTSAAVFVKSHVCSSLPPSMSHTMTK